MFDIGEKKNCLLCSKVAEVLPTGGAVYHLFCENCGEYKITIQAKRVLEFTHEDIRYILSSQTFEKYYYDQEPLTIMAEHIKNAKDITLLEKLYKLSRYLYYETKEKGLGSKIEDISCSQFYCRNNDEYFQILEILKSKNIIDFEKTLRPGSGDQPMYLDPKLEGTAMLAFEEGINTIEDFRETFMSEKKTGNQYNFDLKDGQTQINVANDNAKITATQNNSCDIDKLTTLLESLLKSLPHDLSDEQRTEVNESLSFIKTEMQSPNPRKTVIKNTLFALKGIITTAGFLASLAKVAEFFGFSL